MGEKMDEFRHETLHPIIGFSSLKEPMIKFPIPILVRDRDQ
jgi:hypothetical protein